MAWLWVGLCTLSIFLVVPIARAIQRFVEAHWGASLFGYSVLVAVALGFLGVLYYLWFRLRIRSYSNFAWLFITAAVYVYFTLKLWDRPEEAVHFLEYGLLGFLLFRALRFHMDDKSIYLAAFLAGSIVGILDESFQWITPQRYWDFRDVGLNALSCGLFQVALWKGVRPDLPFPRLKPQSLKIISSLLAANLILLGLCTFNTPARVHRYTKLLPFLSSLRKEEPMNEYKHKHKDPQIGVFFSRLTLQELEKKDREKAEDYSVILKEWKGKKYGAFLQSFPGFSSPFLHEIRVHLFRRNRFMRKAAETKEAKAKKEHLFTAYKENMILEKYFGQTLQKSSYKWPRGRIRRLESEVDKNAPYRSPVSASTFVPFREKTIWMTIGAILFIVVLLNIWYARSFYLHDSG